MLFVLGACATGRRARLAKWEGRNYLRHVFSDQLQWLDFKSAPAVTSDRRVRYF